MGNRRLGTKRLEAVLDNLLGHVALNGVNGSPFVIKDPDRYYVEEYFTDGTPKLNATLIAATHDNAANCSASRTVELAGNAAADGDAARASTGGGVALSGGSNGDVAIVTGHLDSGQSALGGTDWGSETQLEFETIIRTKANIDEMTILAGWIEASKVNNAAPANFATHDEAVYFLFGHADDTGTLATQANLYVVLNHGAGNDVRVKLPIAVAASTSYRLGFTIDSDRKVSAWVNGVQYSLQGKTAAAEYTSAGAGTQKSGALTNDKTFIPVVGIMQQAGNTRTIDCVYIKCSKLPYDNA